MAPISFYMAEKKLAKILGSRGEARDLISRVKGRGREYFEGKIFVEMALFVPPSSTFRQKMEWATFGIYKTPETRVFNILFALENNPLVEKPASWAEKNSRYSMGMSQNTVRLLDEFRTGKLGE